MANMSYNSTIYTSGTSWKLVGDAGETPKGPNPRALFETRAQQLLAGWYGQIIVSGNIVWQSAEPHTDGEAAINDANAHVVASFINLFVEPEDGTS